MKRQFLRYLLSGGSALLTHLAVLYFLVEIFAIDATYASGAGFIVATIQNYLLQHYFVFGAQGGRHQVLFTRYAAVTALTFGANLGLFWCIHVLLGLCYLLSQIVTTGLIFVVNFFINRSYTFREHSSRGDSV